MKDVDREMEKAGKKGHRYVKKSFERRKEQIREKWLRKSGQILREFQKYLKERMGCEDA